jgi:hypothetical protein
MAGFQRADWSVCGKDAEKKDKYVKTLTDKKTKRRRR